MPKEEIMPQPQNGLEISAVELLQRVTSFYEDAWANLIFLVTIFLIFVGFIIPVGIQWYQRRFFRIEEESLKKENRKQVEEIRASLSKELSAELVRREQQQQTQLDSRLAEMKDSLDNRVAWLKGGMFNVQARLLISQGNYSGGLHSYLASAIAVAGSGNEGHLQVTLESIITTLGLPGITKETFNDLEHRHVELFDELISTLENTNVEHRYSRPIGKLKNEWKKANERSPKPSGGNP